MESLHLIVIIAFPDSDAAAVLSLAWQGLSLSLSLSLSRLYLCCVKSDSKRIVIQVPSPFSDISPALEPELESKRNTKWNRECRLSNFLSVNQAI